MYFQLDSLLYSFIFTLSWSHAVYTVLCVALLPCYQVINILE